MTFTLSPDRMPSAIATDPRVAAHTRIGATVNATAAWSSVHSASSSTRRAILWRKNHGEEESRLARSRDMGRPRRRFLRASFTKCLSTDPFSKYQARI